MIAIKTIAARARCVGVAGLFSLFFHSLALAALPIQHWTQPNGAKVYLVESPAIAMLDVQIDLDAGNRRDPADKAGLASMMAGLLEKGVRASNGLGPDGICGGLCVPEPALDENALSEAWADLGAQFGAGTTSDRLSFSLRTLTDPALLDKAAALAAREIAEPAFPEAVWQRERARLQASIRESYTRPASVAGRAYTPAVYGTHPYGYEVTEESLARISVGDMRAAHATGVTACRARISMVGAVTRAQADAIAAKLLSRLPQTACAGLPPLPAVAEVAPLAAAVEKRIPFASAQAQVLIGQPGYKRSDPDYFALTVGNYILGGGGFVSRLASEVREKRGLTYGVSSYFSPALHAGAFTISMQTRPDQAAQAVDLVRKVVADFVANGPLETELKAAKDNLVGGFALRIDSNRKLLDNVSSIAWNDLPLNYLDTWTQQVDKVTVADVKAAFARKLQPEKMVTVILGAAP
ncbi:M16 family metallopeptidase [Polaromonas sp. P5_D5]